MGDAARLKVAVLGPGGVGGFLAAMLARGGSDVLVVERTPSGGNLRLESGRYGTFEVTVRTAERLGEAVDAPAVSSPFAAIELAPSAENRDRVERLSAALLAAGVNVKLREDERAVLWDKFAVLEPMALLTTHARAAIGISRTTRRDDLVGLVTEVVAVGAADGVTLDRDQILKFIDSVPEGMESSMQRDQAAGRPLELDALGGALLRRAEKHGIDVPVTRRLVSDLRG